MTRGAFATNAHKVRTLGSFRNGCARRELIADLDVSQGTSFTWQGRRLQSAIEPVIAVERFGTVEQAVRAAAQWAEQDLISDLQLLDRTFPGGRPTNSGKHQKWDKLFIRVKPPDKSQK